MARDNFGRVLTEARAAVAEEPTAWEALVRLLRQSRELKLSVQLAMVSPMAASIIREDPMTDEFRRVLLSELDAVVHAAQAEGSLRKAIDTEDWSSFDTAFEAMVDAANAYHDVYDKPYLRWKIPEMPPPDLDMTPRR